MNKNTFSSPNSNFINLQEFDDVFRSSSLPKSSRQNSMSLKSKVSSEPPQDFDEDFSAINNLIHQRVNEPSTSQPNSYFKDSPFFDTANIFRVPKLSSETSNNPINDPQIANILAEPPISANRPEPSYFQMGSNPMPEGWLNLFRSLQSEPPGLSPATGSRSVPKKSLRLSKDFESWDTTAMSSWTGANLGKNEVDMKELEDQSNPYKIKSKKEIEEERKKKEQSGQAQPAAKKPAQQELRHAKSNVEKTSGSSAPVVNKPEEVEINRNKKQPTNNYYNESGYNKYNNGYTEPPQAKSTTPKANHDTPVNKKNPPAERYVEPVVAKVTTPKNTPVNETPAVVASKKTKHQQPQKPAIEEKIPVVSSVNKEQPIKQIVEKPKVEEVPAKKPKEPEIKPEVKAKEHKETKKEPAVIVKQPEPIKPVVEKVTPAKPEKPIVIPEKEKEKEIIPKQQEPPVKEKEKEKEKEKKQPEAPKPKKAAKEEKTITPPPAVIKSEPKSEPKPEAKPEPKPEPEPVVEEEEISEPRSSVEQESKGQVDEEFITIGTSKKKKGKKAEKTESKKQMLKEVVKKETEKLIQNPFSALQTSSNPPPAKETKEKEPAVVEVIEPKAKEEPGPVPTLQAEHSSSSASKDKKEKSKKQKKAEKKKAEEAQKQAQAQAQRAAAAAAEVKEEKKEEQPVENKPSENIPVEEKTAPVASETTVTATKGKNKKKAQQASKTEEIPAEVKPVAEPENKPGSVEEDSAKEDEGEDKTDAAGQPSKSKKKKNKKKKNKNKEENAEQGGTIGSSTTQTKTDNRRAAVENDGSTDEDEPGTEKKSEQQFSKSKKKKLKKKAKQQPLFECIKNAENKFLEFLNEYFVEPNGVPDDVAFMEKFKKVLAMQKSMQLELKPAKPSKEVKEIKEIRDPKTKTTIVKERIEEKGPFGETRIKLQVTLRRHNEEEELSEKEKKKKDRRNRSSINEVFENPGDEFDALKKLISEDMGDKRTQNVPSLMNSRQVTDFDNVKEAIEHVESIVKNKSEVQQIRNRKVVETEDLSSLPLHELLERVESRRFRFQEDEDELELTMN